MSQLSTDAKRPRRTTAIVPARGGSKRIPAKNVRPFLGVPILSRTLGVMRDSGLFDRIVVSTDDEEIERIAVSSGAEVPFRRAPELSGDFVATTPVIAHAIGAIEAATASVVDVVCCVYPTAVLVTAEDYRGAHRLFVEGDADYVFTATSFPFPIQRALRRTDDGGTAMFWPEHLETRSQDLEPAYHDAGQFYFGRRDAWLEDRAIFSQRSKMYLLPRHRVQDIDTLEDWERAERLFELLGRQRQQRKPTP